MYISNNVYTEREHLDFILLFAYIESNIKLRRMNMICHSLSDSPKIAFGNSDPFVV